MKKLIGLYILTVLCFSSLAFGQLTSTGAGKKVVGGAAFVGPGDIVSGARAWYGLRAYSTADRGNRLLNVCNVADVACADLSSDATTGALVISSIGGSSCSIIACTIKTFYDRSGNALDLTRATIGDRATLTVSCLGGKPCAVFGVSKGYTVTITSISQPFTISGVGIRTSNFTSSGEFMSFFLGGIDPLFGWNTSTNQMRLYAGSVVTITVSDSNWHSIQAVLNNASSVVNIDGTETTGTIGTTATTTTLAIGSDANGTGNPLFGNIAEIGVWPSGFSAGNRTSMCNNQYTYWGTSVAC